MSIGLAEAREVAALARLQLGEDELARLVGDLSAILDFVAQLQAVDTEGVEPLAHPLPVRNVFRDDEVAPSLPVAEALANAPVRHGDPAAGGAFFGVPAVLD